MKKIIITLLFALTFLVNGCGITSFFDDDEQENLEGISLSLENAGQEGGTLKHPSTLSPTYVANTVNSLYYNVAVSGEISRIFDESDVQDIASKLIGMFQQASDGEKISFKYYGQSARETKGFTYIDKNGYWNWVFQKINGQISDDSWEIYTGKYFRYKIISTLIQGDLIKKNWVLTSESNIPETITGVAGIIHNKDQQTGISNQGSNDSKKELKKISDANKRLRFLNKLLEGGYISQEDYEEQKQRILDRM